MNTVDFAQWVQKNNHKAKGKTLLAFLIFFGIQFLCITFVPEENALLFLLAGQCLAAVAAADVGRYQWNRYLYISGNEIVFEEIPISRVLRLHAFPMREYFGYINKKMTTTAVLLGIVSVLTAILKGFAGDESRFAWEKCLIILWFGIVSAASPFFMGLAKKHFFSYQEKIGTKGGFNHLHQALKGMFLIVEVITVMVVGFASVFLFWIFLGAIEQPAIGETAVVYRMYPYSVSLIFMVIAVFGVFWIGANFNWNKKRTQKMAAIISGMLFLAGILIQIAEMHIYTEITDTQIVIRKLWNVKTYQTEDVKSFRIYNENDNIQMELIFYDESSAKMVGSSMETNDLYDQNYYSEYDYIAEYAEKLKEFGVDGSIRDIEKLRENVADLDSELQKGLEKIINIVPAISTSKAE